MGKEEEFIQARDAFKLAKAQTSGAGCLASVSGLMSLALAIIGFLVLNKAASNETGITIILVSFSVIGALIAFFVSKHYVNKRNMLQRETEKKEADFIRAESQLRR